MITTNYSRRILLSLILPLGSYMLILLCSPITPTHHLTIMASSIPRDLRETGSRTAIRPGPMGSRGEGIWVHRAATVTEMIVHFICRGNAFRSIIAEACLNSLKFENLKAISSGTAAAVDRAGNLAAYTETLGLLAKNGIREFAKTGYGDQLTPSRLAGADVVICMNQRVYDECQQLVSLPAGTRIWSVADIGEAGRVAHTESGKTLYREEAYQEIAECISQLISELP